MTTVRSKADTITPVILCGGSGTRLWPLSRETLPKQFIGLTSDSSLLQNTIRLVSESGMFEAPVAVTNERFHHLVKRQLEDIGFGQCRAVLEPESRSTCAAIAMAAFDLSRSGDPIMLVMPSDHMVVDQDAFQAAVASGRLAAEKGALVTFGMRPNRPETGYGYIEFGDRLAYGTRCHTVKRFIEKPKLAVATEFLASGRFYWNSGMFMFRAKRFLDELKGLQPDLYRLCRVAFQQAVREGTDLRPDPQAFAEIESISVDHAVMEKTGEAIVVAADFGWSDIGSWTALADLDRCDASGNTLSDSVELLDCSGVFVRGQGRLVAGIGLDNLVIVDTEDALLVASKDRVQDVKTIVERLSERGRKEATEPRQVRRPWGSYQSVHTGSAHQVKHIVVDPGEKLSLQYHHHRSEHWIVVSGVAEVTIDSKVVELRANESAHIPLGATHRLYNPGDTPLHLIEVQCGDYLGEDDIVRLEDVYGRVPKVPVVLPVFG